MKTVVIALFSVTCLVSSSPSDSVKSTDALCPFCFQWREPDNHRVRLRPKRRPSARLQRLLGREAKGHKLSLEEKDALRRFRRSSSCLVSYVPFKSANSVVTYSIVQAENGQGILTCVQFANSSKRRMYNVFLLMCSKELCKWHYIVPPGSPYTHKP